MAWTGRETGTWGLGERTSKTQKEGHIEPTMPKDKEASLKRKCCVVAAPGALRKASLGKLQHQGLSGSTTRGTRKNLAPASFGRDED